MPRSPLPDPASSDERFEELVAEAAAVPVDGWDFSWLDGRATEERPSWGYARDPRQARADAVAAGLDVVDLRSERLRTEFFDIRAVVCFLREVIWMVPGFTVEAYRPRLRELHRRIGSEGRFVAHTARFLIKARKPA
ncbi:hypothetical protein [Streptomyces fulvorobeus]|uniref:SAM-dependent methyltransferase n=1 Tax=Streptomyces fulvorobeus TaxID=284028 RepID=A0A7J0CBD4_9ACTN|nr:hypothetical protein [Streptomyces fulvorobeus]NYE42684.1 hypothetical protein [Streptomyces fulvorobeus]GFM99094.1 hypothetical protein Sfulv_39050 [Streptomyces fulvorobeus]